MRKRIIFILVIFVFALKVQAQTGIGTTTPHASAKLEVASDRQGFLPPQVSLTGPFDITTIKNAAGASITPATGLLVYCKGDAGLAAGYYYWNGNAWATIATSGGSGSFAASFLRGSRTATQTLAVDGIVSFSTVNNTAGQDIALNTGNGKITLAPGNTYRIIASVPNFSGGQRPAFMWYNETSSSYIGSASSTYNPGDAASLAASGGIAHVIITPSVSTVLSFRLLSSLSANVTVGGNFDFSTTGSYPWFEAQVISGNAPVTGQSVDYVQASLSANQSLTSAGNINFNVSSGAGISLTSGGFNLLANKTYKLEAALGGTSGGYAYYGWVDNTNTLLPGGSIGTVMKAGEIYTDAPQDNAVVYFTPTVNTTVFLRVYNLSGTLTAYAPSMSRNYSSSWANITQIGSSAIVNPWTLSGTNTYNTTGNVGIGNSSPTTTLDVTGSLQVSGNTTLKSNAIIGTGVGSEGGEIQLVNAVTGSTLSGTAVSVDIYQDRLRIFEGGGSFRGVFLDLAKAPSGVSGELMYKASGFVNRGVDITLGNLKARIAATGNFSLQLSTVSGSYSVYGSHYLVNNGSFSNGIAGSSPRSITTTPTYINSDNNFIDAGNTSVWLLMDTTAQISWRITMIVGAGFNNNFISIERL
jgi:hypothetical protein